MFYRKWKLTCVPKKRKILSWCVKVAARSLFEVPCSPQKLLCVYFKKNCSCVDLCQKFLLCPFLCPLCQNSSACSLCQNSRACPLPQKMISSKKSYYGLMCVLLFHEWQSYVVLYGMRRLLKKASCQFLVWLPWRVPNGYVCAFFQR